MLFRVFTIDFELLRTALCRWEIKVERRFLEYSRNVFQQRRDYKRDYTSWDFAGVTKMYVILRTYVHMYIEVFDRTAVTKFRQLLKRLFHPKYLICTYVEYESREKRPDSRIS
jgi:hypothetical protein